MASDEPLSIPLSIFQDRRLGPLEAITRHLKDECGMRYAEIARALGRDDRTIWTAYHQARRKTDER